MATQRVVGLDLGSSSIKAAQVRIDGEKYIVERTAIRELERGVISDGKINEARIEKLADELRDLFKQAGFQTNEVIVGLTSPSWCKVTVATLPWTAPKDLGMALPLIMTANPSITGGVKAEDFQWDWVPIREFTEGRDKKLEAVIFGAQREAQKLIASVMKTAGLQLIGMDIAGIAALRAMKAPYADARLIHVLVDVGDNLCTTVIHHNGVPMFLGVREGIAGRSVTEDIMEGAGIDRYDDAEEKKRDTRVSTGDVARELERSVIALVGAVKADIDQFVHKNPTMEAGAASVTLMGGGSLLRGLEARLRENLDDIQVDWGSYDPRITQKSGATVDRYTENGQDLATAIGLATGVRA